MNRQQQPLETTPPPRTESADPGHVWRWKPPPAWVGLALAVVTMLLYWPVREFDFTNFDDPPYVTDNPVVQSGLNTSSIRWAFRSTSSSMWHPLTWLGHLATWQVFGPNSGGHHLVNAAFHALNAALVFLVFHQMTHRPGRSAFVAALFAWHPLRVESVAWVAELKDVLSMCLLLLAVMCHVRFARSGRRSAQWLLTGIYFLGLLAKPMLVTLPFALLLLDLWPLRRLRLARPTKTGPAVDGSAEPGPDRESTFDRITWRQAFAEKLPLFVLAAAISILTFVTTRGGQSVAELSIGARVGNAFVSYSRYLGKTFWPSDLAALYPHPGHWPTGTVILAALLFGALSCIAVLAARRRPYLFTGWFWFVGTAVPVIGLVQAGPQAMADRFTYLPSLGLTAALVWGTAGLARHLPFGILGTTGLGIVVVVACLVGTRLQLPHWQNSVSLFERALAVTERNPIAHYNLAQAHSVAGRVAEAVPHYEAAIRLDPKYDAAWNNLGLCHSVLGSSEKAAEHFRRALEIDSSNGDAHYNFGMSLIRAGKFKDALPHLQNAARLAPRHPRVHLELGRLLWQLERPEESIRQLQTGLQWNPRSDETQFELGVLRAARGETNAALVHFQTAVQLNPGSADAQTKLALALTSRGRAAEAIVHYRQALTLAPTAVEPLNNLAWLLATGADAANRDGAEAVRLATQACQLTSNQAPQLIGTLAAAYAEASRFEDAIRSTQQAAELATQLGLTNVALRNAEMQRLFRQGKPFRDP